MESEELRQTAADAVTAFLLFNTLLKEEDFAYHNPELTRSHYEVLYHLLGNSVIWKKHSLTMSEIAKKLSFSKPYVTALVDRLIAKGFVTRMADDKDRRIINIALTASGTEDTIKHQNAIYECVYLKISKLSPEELQKVKELVPDVKYLCWRLADVNR
jgi:DNA-binding MarR family transcriptional regulator